MVKVELSKILYIEGLSNYVKFFTEGKTLISYQKLTYLEEILPSDQFIRSHRSYIVNIHQINAFTATDLEIGKGGVTYWREVSGATEYCPGSQQAMIGAIYFLRTALEPPGVPASIHSPPM